MRIGSNNHAGANVLKEMSALTRKAKKREDSNAAPKHDTFDNDAVTYESSRNAHPEGNVNHKKGKQAKTQAATADGQQNNNSVIKAEENPFETANSTAAQSDAAVGTDAKSTSPTDDSGELTKRLVAAQDTFSIQMILSDAFKSMGPLRIAAATGSEDDAKAARSILKKLEKLVNRCRRKIKDLGGEEQLLLKQMKAERDEKAQQAKEIKTELRKREIERKRREQGYLRETAEEAIAKSGSYNDFPTAPKLDAATEAKITAQADAMALASTATSTSSSTISSADSPVTEGGGKSADGAIVSNSSGGGEIAAADVSGIDIAV